MIRNDHPPEKARDLPDALPEDVARTIVLNALSYSAKTRKQLADLLRKKAVPDEVASAVLDRFTQVGLIDDLQFAKQWVRSRQSSRGLARRVLRQELMQRGISQDDIEGALLEVDDESEAAAVFDLAERKFRSMSHLDHATAKRRLSAVLARKGYSYAVVDRAVVAAMSEATVDG